MRIASETAHEYHRINIDSGVEFLVCFLVERWCIPLVACLVLYVANRQKFMQSQIRMRWTLLQSWGQIDMAVAAWSHQQYLFNLVTQPFSLLINGSINHQLTLGRVEILTFTNRYWVQVPNHLFAWISDDCFISYGTPAPRPGLPQSEPIEHKFRTLTEIGNNPNPSLSFR